MCARSVPFRVAQQGSLSAHGSESQPKDRMPSTSRGLHWLHLGGMPRSVNSEWKSKFVDVWDREWGKREINTHWGEGNDLTSGCSDDGNALNVLKPTEVTRLECM